jgi:hypothetical protein
VWACASRSVVNAVRSGYCLDVCGVERLIRGSVLFSQAWGFGVSFYTFLGGFDIGSGLRTIHEVRSIWEWFRGGMVG